MMINYFQCFGILYSALVKRILKTLANFTFFFGNTIWENFTLYNFQPVQVHSRRGSFNPTSVGCSYALRLFMKDQWMTVSVLQ